jgi:transposase-like protein
MGSNEHRWGSLSAIVMHHPRRSASTRGARSYAASTRRPRFLAAGQRTVSGEIVRSEYRHGACGRVWFPRKAQPTNCPGCGGRVTQRDLEVRFLIDPGRPFLSADTNTRPVPGSTVHSNDERCSAPSNAATAAGIVVRSDADRGVTRKAVEWKVPDIDSPITFTDGRLFTVALTTGLPIGQFLKYHRRIGLTVGQRGGALTMEVDGGRAQRGLIIATKADVEIKTFSWCSWIVRSQNPETRNHWYRVVRAGTHFKCECPDATNHPDDECKHASAVRFAERIRAAVRRDFEKRATESGSAPSLPPCRSCGGTTFIQKGIRQCLRGTVQRFKCKGCGRRFTLDDGFARLKCRPEIVSAVFDLHASGMHYRGIRRHMREHWKGADGEGVSISIGTVTN